MIGKRTLAAALMAGLMLTSCASGSDTTSSTSAGTGGSTASSGGTTFEKKDPLKLGYSVYDLSIPAFQDWEAGVKAGAEEGGAELVTVDQKSSEATQVSGSADLINQGISGLIVTPVQPAALPETIDLAHQNKIPVVIGDIGVAGDYDAYVVSDSKDAGAQAAKYFMDQFKDATGTVEVGVLELHPGSVVGEDRQAGFEEEIAKDSKFKIVASLNGNDTVDGGYSATKDMLAANPNIKAIFGVNGGTALGASRALLEAGKTIGTDGVVVIGIDGTQPELDAIKAGELSATIGQDFYGLGKLAAQTALQLLDGTTPEFNDAATKTLVFPVETVTADNVDDFIAAKKNH